MKPDAYFDEVQMQCLAELMARWRAARDGGTALLAEEQTELEQLITAELKASMRRATDRLNAPQESPNP